FGARREAEEGASGLDRLDYPPRIVTAEYESACISILLHRPPQRGLCIACHVVSFIKHKNLERHLAQRSHPCKLLHRRPDNVNTSVIARGQLHENILESRSE